jgi:hypothetical protein
MYLTYVLQLVQVFGERGIGRACNTTSICRIWHGILLELMPGSVIVLSQQPFKNIDSQLKTLQFVKIKNFHCKSSTVCYSRTHKRPPAHLSHSIHLLTKERMQCPNGIVTGKQLQ